MGDFVISTKGLKEKFDSTYCELRKEIKSPNVLLLGQTGVGKSTLINTIFGKELAAVSHTKPQTKGFHRYSQPNMPINIIDSEGYELEDSNQFKETLTDYIDSNFTDISQQIHLAWYCISVSGARVLPYDLENIAFLEEKKIPVCVVLTQCDNDTLGGTVARALQAVVMRKFFDRVPCFQVSNDSQLNKELDMLKLIDWSMNNLRDENLRLGFLIAQCVDLDRKADKAYSRIKYYAAGAAAIGVSPIPMSDALLLTGLQTAMASDIFSIYGLQAGMSTTLQSIIGGRVVSMIGKTVAGNLLKMIPGVGSVAGSAINGAVATTITYSLGYALSTLSKKVIENHWVGNAEAIEETFSEVNVKRLIGDYQRTAKR